MNSFILFLGKTFLPFVFALVAVQSAIFSQSLLTLESKYSAKYKKDEINATLSEGAKLSSDFFKASVFEKQTPEHSSLSENLRCGVALESPTVETDAASFCFGAQALSLSYGGIFSRLKNPEKLITSSSPLSTSLSLPRKISARLPSISSSKQPNSAHFELCAETDKTASTSDFTLFDDKSFAASASESLLLSDCLLSFSSAALFQENEKRGESAVVFSCNGTRVAGVVHATLTKNALSLCALGALSTTLETRNFGVYTIQGAFFKGTQANKIKNMESGGLVCDFLQNRVRIGARAIRTEKEAQSATNLCFGIRFKTGNLVSSLTLSDALEKPSVALSVSDKLDSGLRLSLSTKTRYDKSSETLSASVRTGIRTEDCAFADWTFGATEKIKAGEIQKKALDSSISLKFGGTVRCIAIFSYSAEF